MKKVLFWILVVCLCVMSVAFSFAEETEGTKFEKVLLTKGSLLKKEFITVASLSCKEFDYNISGQAAILTDMKNGSKVYALRLEHSYWNSKYDSGTSIAVLDMDEIDSVILALESLKTEFSKKQRSYTEYIYETTDGLKIGAYYNGKKGLFIQFSSSDTEYCEFTYIDDVIGFFQKCKTSIEKEMK